MVLAEGGAAAREGWAKRSATWATRRATTRRSSFRMICERWYGGERGGRLDARHASSRNRASDRYMLDARPRRRRALQPDHRQWTQWMAATPHEGQLRQLPVKSCVRPSGVRLPNERGRYHAGDRAEGYVQPVGFPKRLDEPVGSHARRRDPMMVADHRRELRRPFRPPGAHEVRRRDGDGRFEVIEGPGGPDAYVMQRRGDRDLLARLRVGVRQRDAEACDAVGVIPIAREVAPDRLGVLTEHLVDERDLHHRDATSAMVRRARAWAPVRRRASPGTAARRPARSSPRASRPSRARSRQPLPSHAAPGADARGPRTPSPPSRCSTCNVRRWSVARSAASGGPPRPR